MAGHTLVDIVAVDPTRRDLVERAAIHDLVTAAHAEGRRTPTIGIAHLGRNLCPSLLRHMAYCVIGRIDFC